MTTAAHAAFDTSAAHAARLDAADPLRAVRGEFEFPTGPDGKPLTYLCGNSLGLLPRAADRVRTFSGGMQRRLNLAAALVHDPGAILLDEPTAGVDPQSRTAILSVVQRLAAEGRAVVYTTHYMEEAERACGRVAIIDHGRMLDVGTVAELLARHGGDSLEDLFLHLTGRSVRD
jgi:ABC-2 type transport system ATP-binding protein